MLQSLTIRKQIEVYTSNGNKYLSNAVKFGNRDAYLKAIQEFVLSYKFALLLNSQDGMDQMCAFNLGAAHIAGGDVMRGINLLQTLLENFIHSQTYENVQGADSKKGDIYYNLATGYEKLNDVDNAIKNYQHALLEYSDDEKDRKRISETHLKLANIHSVRKEFSDAYRYFSKAATFYEKLGDERNEILALVCQANAAVLDTAVSRDECHRLLDVCYDKCQKLKRVNLQGKILCEIGLLYSSLGRLNHALECLEKSLRMCNRNTNPRRQAIALQNAGAILNSLGFFAEAISRHIESAKLHGVLRNRGAQGQSFCNLGFAQSQLEKYEESWEAYIHALQAFKDTDDKQGQWQCHEALGSISFNMGRTEKAIQHFKLALSSNDKHKEKISHDRIVGKLSEALKMKAGSALERDLRLAIEDRQQRENRSANVGAIAAGPYDIEAEESKPHSKRRKKSRLRRGKRRYSDKNDQPVMHIARGISNLTQTSNPLAASYRSPDTESDSSSGRVFEMEKLSRSSSSDESTGSSSDEEKKRVLGKNDKSITRKKQLQNMVQATTMPITSLTLAQDGTPRNSQSREGSVESTPRTVSSSAENMTQVYKDQLDKIEEEELTDVTSYTSSGSESESESDEEFAASKKTPVKPPRKTPDRLKVAYVNDEEVLYTKSLKQTDKPNKSNLGFQGGQSTHIYESIKTAGVDAPHVQTSSKNDNPPDKNTAESNSSGDDAPPLSTLYGEKNDGDLKSSSESSEDSDTSPESPELPVHHSVDMQNRPLPSPGKKKKNDKSRACAIM